MRRIGDKIKNNFDWRACRPSQIFYAAALLLILGGGFQTTTAQKQLADDAPLAVENYRIGVGDVLRVQVVRQPLLSADAVRVGNDGTIRLPMLDEGVRAACLTENELLAAVTDAYKKYLLNPQVYLAVREFNANPVALVGAVVAPGRFQLQRRMRLLELLTYVSGPAPNAGRSIQIIRNPGANRCGQTPPENPAGDAADGAPEIITLPLAEVLKGGETVNPFVQPGDIISIAEAELRQAFIVGSVRAAAAVSLKEPVTLSKAIAMAGGIAPGANIEKIRISRQAADSLEKTEIVVNLKEINKQQREDVLLQPNDIVDVPGPSGTRKFLRDVFRSVVPAVTRVPLIIP